MLLGDTTRLHIPGRASCRVHSIHEHLPRERHDMSTTLATPALSAFSPRTVIADPGDNPGVSEVRPGGILVWTNRSAQLRHFAIAFRDNAGRGPASPGDTLAGTGSIVVH